MPVDEKYKALGWSQKQYAKHVGSAGMGEARASGVFVQPVSADRAWIVSWVGSNDKVFSMGVLVYSDGSIQGSCCDGMQGSGFSSEVEARNASIALGYSQYSKAIVFEGQLALL
jgi:hypothetical protein